MIWIIVRTQFIGYHYWKDAPPEVEFLRSPHRHKFFVELQVEVKNHDRQLEFFIIQRELQAYIKDNFEEFEFDYSCENIAQIIKDYFENKYLTKVKVGVFEDNENGALIE